MATTKTQQQSSLRKPKKASTSKKRSPGPIDLITLKKIMDAYHANPAGAHPKDATQWAHLPLGPLADFMIGQGIPPGTTLEELRTGTLAFGLRIYMTQHVNSDDFPDPNGDYKGRNSVALAVTFSPDFGTTWFDLDNPNQPSVLVPGKVISNKLHPLYPALDRTELYPPGGATKHPNTVKPSVITIPVQKK